MTSVSLAVALILSGIGTAFAQSTDDSAAAADQDDGTLAEVVVTAEKRVSSEQKTPIAMSVFSTEELQRNGVGNLSDLTSIAPSVAIGKGNATQVVTIRGVSSRDTTETGDPAVAVSVDGFYFQRAIGLADSVFDLERVEVLRGPQGTLYGRNATGGAINFITAKPTREFEGRASVNFGNYDQTSFEGALNVPLSDRVQMRASFYTRSHDGFRENAPAQDGDDADAKAARLHVQFEPTDQFTALLTAEFSKLGGVGPAVYGSPLVFDGTGNVVHEKPPLPKDAKEWPMSLPTGFMDSTSKSLRWKFDYDFGAMDLTYLGGYRRLDYHANTDLDGVEDLGFYFQVNEKPTTWNHELRLSSKADTALTWQVGSFYFEEKNDLLSFFQNYNVPSPPANLFIFTYPDIVAKSSAVFGQGGYNITDTFKLEAGIRYTKDKKRRVGSLNYGSGVLLQDAASTSSETTYHLSANWQATPTNLLYAKYATGYKAGGFTDAAPYDPESIKSYEIGSKNRFRGNTVQLNAAAFYYDYTDQQISQFTDGQTFIRNAGKSEIYGIELDGSALLTKDDRIDGYIGYLHAEFKDFALAAGSINVQLAGNRPPQSPRLSATVGYQHRFSLANGASLTARVQSRYEAVSYLTVYNYANDRQGGYNRSDAILTYAASDDKWSVEAYGRNLENKRVLAAAQENGLWGTYNYQFLDPRTYGVRVNVNWR